MEKRIYIADDEENIRELMRSFLTRDGFSVDCFADGEKLLAAFEARPPDLIILDIMMPGIDGLSLCSLLRQKSAVPIIIVSAKDSELDRITGISIGSDDYMVKPFSPLELVARVKALFRRVEMARKESGPGGQENLCYGDLTLDLNLRSASRGGAPFAVTPTEFDFLSFMIQNSARAVSKSELLKALWQFDFDADTRASDDLVKRLRKKLKECGSTLRIETVWGFGFRLGEEPEDPGAKG